LTIHAEPRADVLVGGTPYTADAAGLTFSGSERGWKVIT
jgi:hypothetical protein